MEIEKRKVISQYSRGSCNFCSKGKLSASQTNLIYPYNEVIVIYGDTVEIRFCKECFDKLKDIDFGNLKLVENDCKANSINI